MKNYFKIGLFLLAVTLYSCGGGDGATDAKTEDKALVNPNNPNNPASSASSNEADKATEVPASERIDLVNKGVGPVKSVTIAETIDQALAKRGQEVYEKNCTACHKVDKKFIGPAPKGILERRTPE